MSGYNYSVEALNNLKEFHRVRIVVYVEGPEDIPFWKRIFRIFNIEHFIVKPAGGITELMKYVDSVVNENADIFIARDLDYDEIMGKVISHARIAYTYGHSIENTLCSPNIVAQVIENLAQISGEYSVEKVEEWLISFTECFRDLVAFEIANTKYCKGVRVLGDNCSRYMDRNQSISINEDFIISHARELELEFAPAEIQIGRDLLDTSDRRLAFVIRGHFLISAVLKYVKTEVERLKGTNITLPRDNLLSLLVANISPTTLTPVEHEHYSYQMEQFAQFVA
jgi:hypothetical protein